MRTFKALRGVGVAACLAAGVVLGVASGASGAPLKICVPEKEGAAIKTAKGGVCSAKTTATVLLPEAEEEKLAAILPYEKYVASGIGGKPTIEVSGVNVQIVNGTGATTDVNGEGNLVIGYDENPAKHAQTGSHDLILGEEQTFTSYAGLVAGSTNSITAPYASVSGGLANAASDSYSTVGGGGENKASGLGASVSGGTKNTASAEYASISNGYRNTASAAYSSVSGGALNTAGGRYSSVSGGVAGSVSGENASLSGGFDNDATGENSSVSGGVYNEAEGVDASVSGGDGNLALGGVLRSAAAPVTTPAANTRRSAAGSAILRAQTRPTRSAAATRTRRAAHTRR